MAETLSGGENKHSEFFESKVLGHPAGLFVLFFTEMWERFSFYGMRVLLINFLTIAAIGSNPGWEWSTGNAGALFGTYAGLLYLTPIVGGLIADKWVGYRWAVVIGCIIMTAGHASMAFETEGSLYIGLALLVIGTGFFKPNITSIISEMYEYLPEKKDGAYTIFYMGVNSGAFFGMMLCGYIAERVGWAWGFGLAGVFMLFGTLQFMLAKKLFGNVGGVPKKLKKEVVAVETEEKTEEKKNQNRFTVVDKVLIVVTAIIGLFYLIDDPLAKIQGIHILPEEFLVSKDIMSGSLVVTLIGLALFLYLIITRIRRYDKVLRDRMIAVIIFAFFTVLFFIPFEQAATSMVLFARDYTTRVLTGNAATIFNVFNTLLTVIPLGIITWVLILLNKKSFKKIPGSNMVLAVCFAIMWGMVIWMLNKDFNTKSYDAEYATVPVEKIINKEGELVYEQFGLNELTPENIGQTFQEGDTIAVRLGEGDYVSLDTVKANQVVVNALAAIPSKKYMYGSVEDADSAEYHVTINEVRDSYNRSLFKPINEVPDEAKSFFSTPIVGLTTPEPLLIGSEVALPIEPKEEGSDAAYEKESIVVEIDRKGTKTVPMKFAYGKVAKNNNGELYIDIEEIVVGKSSIVYEPITEERPLFAGEESVMRTLHLSSSDELEIGSEVATHIELGKFVYLNTEKDEKLKADYASAGLPSKIIDGKITELKENEVEITVSWFSILNSFFIIAFASAFSKWWDSKYNPSAAMKYGLGLVTMAVGFAILAYGASFIPAGSPAGAVRVGMIWLILAYLFHTLGELCLSPVGLSYVSKLVPARMIAFMFGMWYLAIAIGNKVAASLGGMVDEIQNEYSLSVFFLIFTVIPAVAGILVMVLNPLLKKLMHGVK